MYVQLPQIIRFVVMRLLTTRTIFDHNFLSLQFIDYAPGSQKILDFKWLELKVFRGKGMFGFSCDGGMVMVMMMLMVMILSLKLIILLELGWRPHSIGALE